MVGVNLIYRFSVDGGISRGEFSQAVHDSVRDRVEGTGCMGDLLSDLL